MRYSFATVRDRYLNKLLRQSDFAAGRQLLYKQYRDNPDDPALCHNKALMLSF